MATESKAIELGVSCPDFHLLGVDGAQHSRDDYSRSKVLVVGFTCNHCPYVQAYEDRVNELAKSFSQSQLSIVCINSNDPISYPDDSFEKMKERAELKSFQFDYLQDESQEVAKAFNAACTPEFYCYDQNRVLRYHGRLDDEMKELTKIKSHYLRDAIEDLLAERLPRVDKSVAIGCSIKWAKAA